MTINPENILTQLDKEAESFSFPMFDNGYYYHGDQKLTIFRDNTRWAMTIEQIAYNNHCYEVTGITTIVSAFGNCILTEQLNDNGNFFFFANDNEVESFLYDDGNMFSSYLNPQLKNILVRDQIVPIINNSSYYFSKGIDLQDSNKVTPWEFMRGLIPEKSELLWVTRQDISNKIPLDLPVLMTLNNWYHPDLAAGQMPSETETFQHLAQVISTGDIGFYNPAEKQNTHWKNWPEGGTL